ncbi:glycosyltransferase family 39 protein [Patescibacteria group bacterium]|nr:glycosyltransferase family 39 protein [Patescibacteria group bacterium]
MKKLDLFLLTMILLVGLALRLYKIDIPLADFHSWRQADTAAVARNFLRGGFDLLHPRYDDLSNVQSGFENPQGYRMVEFPIYNAIFAYGYQLMPSLTLEEWGRLVSIFFSLVIIAVIYYLLLKEKDRLAAFFASFIYAVFPFFVFFSRVVLPESTALGFTFLAILFLYVGNPKKTVSYTIYLILSIISFAVALLVMPTTIFFGLPLAYIFFKNYKWKTVKNPLFYLYFLIAVAPLFLWRNYIKSYPEGIPVNEWLFTSVNTGGGLQNVFFRPAFFRWIFFDRINNLILGGYLTVFFVLGIVAKQKRWLPLTILFASIVYLFTFQGGNVQHVYYQTLILPGLAIFTGLGVSFLAENRKIVVPFLVYVSIPIMFALSWFFSFYQVKSYYDYSAELVQEAQIINSLTSSQDKIVTDRMGDTTLLYLSDRRGAPAIYKDPKDLKNLGYSYLVTSSQTEINLLKDKYEAVFENDKFSIFKL